jgi:hypothetical protein
MEQSTLFLSDLSPIGCLQVGIFVPVSLFSMLFIAEIEIAEAKHDDSQL